MKKDEKSATSEEQLDNEATPITDAEIEAVIEDLEKEEFSKNSDLSELINSIEKSDDIFKEMAADEIYSSELSAVESQTAFGKVKQLFDFRYNFINVMGFWVVVAIISFSAYWGVNYFVSKNKVSAEPPIIKQHDFGGIVSEIDLTDQNEKYYDSGRWEKFSIQLKKIIVNISPSSQSGRSPMLIFEIFVETLDPETHNEIKEREPEVLDKISRATEAFTYDELSSVEGKRELSIKIEDVLNEFLRNKKVESIYYNSFILKP